MGLAFRLSLVLLGAALVASAPPAAARCPAASAAVPPPPPALVAVPLDPLLGDARVGGLFPRDLVVRVVDQQGRAAPFAPVQWSVAPGSGWVFPKAPTADASGVASARWIAGPQPLQAVYAVPAGTVWAPALFSARGVEAPSRANYLALWFDAPGPADAYAVEVSPLSGPPHSYYEAIGVPDTSYMGIQFHAPADHGHALLFSAWDGPAGDAVVVDPGQSRCKKFGGEGTGMQCFADYPLQVGGRYRFELSVARGSASTDLRGRFVDLAHGRTIELATLRVARRVPDASSIYSFAEDFGPPSRSCIAADERHVAVGGVAAHVDGRWVPIQRAYFDPNHPLEECANIAAAAEGGAWVLSSGGSVVGNPGDAKSTLALGHSS
jgi:hypothetical protein